MVQFRPWTTKKFQVSIHKYTTFFSGTWWIIYHTEIKYNVHDKTFFFWYKRLAIQWDICMRLLTAPCSIVAEKSTMQLRMNTNPKNSITNQTVWIDTTAKTNLNLFILTSYIFHSTTEVTQKRQERHIVARSITASHFWLLARCS